MPTRGVETPAGRTGSAIVTEHMSHESPLLHGLNPDQRAAVEAVEGPVLILAGPGSGKTRVITHRIAYLMREVGISPLNILAVTFTNKAARSMMERLEQLAPGDARRLTMGTFHAVCARILRRDGPQIGIGSNFTIYDDGDQMNLVRTALKELNLDEKQHPPRAILARISNAKSDLKGPTHFSDYTTSYWEEIVLRVYRRYQELLAASNALDFDDLLMHTVRLFQERPDVLARYQERYVHVLVDEFQDTNVAQYQIVKMIAARHRNLCVVGDEDQCLAGGTLRRDGRWERAADRAASRWRLRPVRPREWRVQAGASAPADRALEPARGRRDHDSRRPAPGQHAGARALRWLRPGVVPQTHFTYLMRRQGVGFRLGTTRVYSRGQPRSVAGFSLRLTQERGDALWIVSTHRSEREARAEEYVLSLRYRFRPCRSWRGAPAAAWPGRRAADWSRIPPTLPGFSASSTPTRARDVCSPTAASRSSLRTTGPARATPAVATSS